MDELIAKLNRLKEIDVELAQVAENRKAIRVLESGYRQERAAVVAAMRDLGVTLARPRKAKAEKKPKTKKTTVEST